MVTQGLYSSILQACQTIETLKGPYDAIQIMPNYPSLFKTFTPQGNSLQSTKDNFIITYVLDKASFDTFVKQVIL